MLLCFYFIIFYEQLAFTMEDELLFETEESQSQHDECEVRDECEVTTTPKTARKTKKRARTVLHEWNDSEINNLISAVETKVELWKSNHELYKNKLKKDAAWRDISENVFDSKLSSSELNTKWSNLRVQYKTYAAKYKLKPSGSGAQTINKWKFFDCMSFIDGNNESIQATESNLPMVFYFF